MMSRISYVCSYSTSENLSISLILNSKLIEQLKVYYTKWKLLSHTKETLSLSAGVRKPLSLVVHNPLRSTRAPAISQNQLRLHHATKGLIDIPTTSYKTVALHSSSPNSPNTPMEVQADSHHPPTSESSVTGIIGNGLGIASVPLSASPSRDN